MHQLLNLVNDPDSLLPQTVAECEQEITELSKLAKEPLLIRVLSRFALELAALENELDSPPVDVASILLRERLFGQRRTLRAVLSMLNDEIDILVQQKSTVENPTKY